jgi:elongation factor P
MIGALELKTGNVIRLDNALWVVLERQHVKPGKGGAFVRLKLKQVVTGAVVDRTYRGGEKFDDVRLEKTPMEFLYESGGDYHFMNSETYDQTALTRDFLGNSVNYLKANVKIEVLMHDGNPVTFELPTFVELRVEKTDPGVKGDTATGGTKPATLESGAVVHVPLFVEEGETIKVDTRTGTYVERVS